MAYPSPLGLPMFGMQQGFGMPQQQQPLTDEQQAQAALEAINQQIQGLGGQAPEPMGPPGFLERLFQSGAGEPTFQPMGIASGFLQGLAGGLASRGQKVAQKRQQVEALIESQRQQKNQQQLKDLEQRQTEARAKVNELVKKREGSTLVTPELVKQFPGLGPFKGQSIPRDAVITAALKPPGSDQFFTLSPGGLNLAAKVYETTGGLPGRSKTSAQIINAAAAANPTADIATNKAIYQTTKESLGQLRKIKSAGGAFAETAKKNADVLRGTLSKAVNTGAPWLNKPIRDLSGATGDPNISAFRAALKTVVPEYAKLLRSASASGVLTDEANREISNILSDSSTPSQILASLDILDQDAANRNTSYGDAIKDLEYQLAHPGQERPAAAQPVSEKAATHRYNPATGTVVPIGP